MLAKRGGSWAFVIRDFRFANRCHQGDIRVPREIRVGRHYRFRFSSPNGITIQGSFVRAFVGDLFNAGPSGGARGTVRFQSSHCKSGAVAFFASS